MIGSGELLSMTSPFHEDHGVVSLCSLLVGYEFVHLVRELGFGNDVL